MKKILIAAAITMMCGSAFAQNSTGPAPQSDTMNKPGTSGNGMSNGSASGMQSGTTGMNNAASQRDNPNGSPGGMPKATTGPAGDASKSENGKH